MSAEVYKGQDLTDPFNGGEVSIVQVAGGLYWQGRGKNWSTKLFDDRRSLVHFLSTRRGKEPPFDASPWIGVKVPERAETLSDADQVKQDRREMNEMVNEAFDRTVFQPAVGVSAR